MTLGHAGLAELFLDPVVIEEKIDGSQFSFGLIDGVPRFRSKGQEIIPLPDGSVPAGAGMFQQAVRTVMSRISQLKPEWVYRCEFLNKPKHNTLAYDRVPEGGLIVFDIEIAEESFLNSEARAYEVKRIGLESIPVLFEGEWTAGDMLGIEKLLDTVSVLGGSKIEGIVIKNYARFGRDKKILIGKYVSEAFKEVHRGDWKQRNPNREEFIAALAGSYTTPARWAKALQHLTEAGQVEGSPRDIGLLVKEVPEDILEECGKEIQDALFDHFWPLIRRQVIRGLPEWYRDQLLRAQFKEAMTA